MITQPKETVFLEKGTLTIQEFLEAGDTLVQKCPTWEWVGCDDPKKLRKEFPPDKQFLVTRHVPCQKRLKDVMESADGCAEVDVGDGWTDIDNPEGVKGEGGDGQEAMDLDSMMNTANVVEEPSGV